MVFPKSSSGRGSIPVYSSIAGPEKKLAMRLMTYNRYMIQAIPTSARDKYYKLFNLDGKYLGYIYEQYFNLCEKPKAPEIEMVRAIWPIYKANDCYNFNLPKDLSVDEAKKTLFSSVVTDLRSYDEVGKKLDELSEEWHVGHRLNNVNTFVSRANEILNELNSIPLELRSRENTRISAQEMIQSFHEYLRTARDLTEDILRVGDIIRMKKSIYEKNLREHPDNLIYNENLFTVGNISMEGQVMTRESNLPLTYNGYICVARPDRGAS